MARLQHQGQEPGVGQAGAVPSVRRHRGTTFDCLLQAVHCLLPPLSLLHCSCPNNSHLRIFLYNLVSLLEDVLRRSKCGFNDTHGAPAVRPQPGGSSCSLQVLLFSWAAGKAWGAGEASPGRPNLVPLLLLPPPALLGLTPRFGFVCFLLSDLPELHWVRLQLRVWGGSGQGCLCLSGQIDSWLTKHLAAFAGCLQLVGRPSPAQWRGRAPAGGA